jgi:hypothetical protein
MKYQIVIKFETDRPLTPEEQFQIVAASQVQVEEPATAEGEPMKVEVKEVAARISEAE